MSFTKTSFYETLKEFILPLVLIQMVFLGILSNILYAEFDLVDDYIILVYLAEEPLQPMYPIFVRPATVEQLLLGDLSYNRFRPVYWTNMLIVSNILGDNPHLWHLYRVECGVFVCFLFYLIMRRLNVQRWLAALFVFWIGFQGSFAAGVWTRLGPAETLGIVLLSISLYSLVRAAQQPTANRWDISMILFLGLAGGVKETFILVAPGVILLRLVLAYGWHNLTLKQLVQRFWGVCLAAGIINLIEVGIILSLVSTQYLEGVGLGVDDPLLHFIQSIGRVVLRMGGGVPILIALVLIAIGYARYRISLRPLWLFVPLALATLPQFLIYYRSFEGHYIYPAVFGMVAMVVLLLYVASQAFPRLVIALILPGVIAAGYFTTLEIHLNTIDNRLTTAANQDMLRMVRDKYEEQHGYTVLVYPQWNSEEISATLLYLGYYGVDEKISYAQPAQLPTPPYLVVQEEVVRDVVIVNLPDISTLKPEEICVVVGYSYFTIPNLLADQPPEWFQPEEYERINIRYSQNYWTIRGMQEAKGRDWTLFLRRDCQPES